MTPTEQNDTKELCNWLRENSSGAYRKAAEAADVIESLLDRLERAEAELASIPQFSRAALMEFIEKVCLGKLELVACAESAFYWFSKCYAIKGAAAGAVPEGFKWPEPPPRKQSATLFDDGYEEGWAKAIDTVRALLAAAPSAPVAAPRALVTPDMAGSPCSQCGQLGTHLCAASAAPVAAQAEPDQRLDDLRLLVGRLVRALRKAAPGNELAEQAVDYLARAGLKGSPLRAAQAEPVMTTSLTELRDKLHLSELSGSPITLSHYAAGALHHAMTTPPAPMQEAGDALLVELRDWFEAQRKAISKGCGSAWDMAQCAEQIEKINRAIATSKEEA